MMTMPADHAAMCVSFRGGGFDDLLHDGQSQAGAGGVAARRFEPGKGTLDAFDILRRYAGTAVAHFDHELAGGGAQAQIDRTVCTGMAQRVVDQVADGAAQGLGGLKGRTRWPGGRRDGNRR